MNNLKLSVLSRNRDKDNYEERQLFLAAKRNGLSFEKVCIGTISDLEEIVEKLGDIVIARTTGLDLISKNIFLKMVSEEKLLVNNFYLDFPFISYKNFQQYFLSINSDIRTIPAFEFATKVGLKKCIDDNKELTFPIIMKPKKGARGENIHLLERREDPYSLADDLSSYIFQNFIHNRGDYRVFVVGGRAVAFMRRVAKKGTYLNNYSKGGRIYKVKDKNVIKRLSDIATNVAAVFKLTIAGIDILEDLNGNLYFMELNTIPQWRGIEKINPDINVADEIVRLSINLYERRKDKSINDIFRRVKRYYDDNYPHLYHKKFHYSSRQYLWTGSKREKQRLERLKKEYAGETEKERDKLISESLETDLLSRNYKAKQIRQSFFKKYKKLRNFIMALFKVLLAETIYNVDLRDSVSKFISSQELIKLYNDLYKDREAIASLSTDAINYFYLTRNYFRNNLKDFGIQLDPHYFLEIAQKNYEGKPKEYLELQIYLLTHCIIGESRFYAKLVDNKFYKRMLVFLESLISKNFPFVRLDNKFEFLVCCQLCNYKPGVVRDWIYQEAQGSYSKLGDYLVDRLFSGDGKKDTFIYSEHRNVLFLMSLQKFMLS